MFDIEDKRGGANMINEKQIEIIKRIFDKCIEVNKKMRAEAFFTWHAHVQQIDVDIYIPNWKKKCKHKNMHFYYDNLDGLYDNPTTNVYKLDEIEKELNKYI